jgi:hypothetical protein
MRDYIEKACEEIDAAMFSGDAFIEEDARKSLQDYIDRWTREMKRWEETAAKIKEKMNIQSLPRIIRYASVLKAAKVMLALRRSAIQQVERDWNHLPHEKIWKWAAVNQPYQDCLEALVQSKLISGYDLVSDIIIPIKKETTCAKKFLLP